MSQLINSLTITAHQNSFSLLLLLLFFFFFLLLFFSWFLLLFFCFCVCFCFFFSMPLLLLFSLSSLSLDESVTCDLTFDEDFWIFFFFLSRLFVSPFAYVFSVLGSFSSMYRRANSSGIVSLGGGGRKVSEVRLGTTVGSSSKLEECLWSLPPPPLPPHVFAGIGGSLREFSAKNTYQNSGRRPCVRTKRVNNIR